MLCLRVILLFSTFLLVLPSVGYAKNLCTIVIDVEKNTTLYEEGDCEARVTPASTTKILFAVIGFESGFLATPNSPILKFEDGYADWLGDIWKQPIDPSRWLKYSVVWYSQLLTHYLGQERLEKYAANFGFGNADFSGDSGKMNGLERAWISSSLKVSPREQVVFLKRLVNRTLPVDSSVYAKVYDSVEKFPAADGWTISGKTGMAFPRIHDGELDAKKGYGWFVGWAVKEGRTVIFARLVQDEKGQILKIKGSTSYHARDSVIAELPRLARVPR